ncbi:uncharacterized protein LOC115224789 isoform X1, partial [Argonauta hians]
DVVTVYSDNVSTSLRPKKDNVNIYTAKNSPNVLCEVPPSTGLSCYSCSGSMPFSKCESDRKEFRRGLDSKYAVNCTEYSNMKTPYCAIESYMRNGEVYAIIRDCNTRDYSVNTKHNKYKILGYLNPRNNKTLCTVTGWSAMCITLCDTDMCNGPSKAHHVTPLSVAVLLFVSWLTGCLLLDL